MFTKGESDGLRLLASRTHKIASQRLKNASRLFFQVMELTAPPPAKTGKKSEEKKKMAMMAAANKQQQVIFDCFNCPVDY